MYKDDPEVQCFIESFREKYGDTTGVFHINYAEPEKPEIEDHMAEIIILNIQEAIEFQVVVKISIFKNKEEISLIGTPKEINYEKGNIILTSAAEQSKILFDEITGVDFI
ncbi:YolD-like family protein [Jeotgalibacillus malaysiensis]|uniref:YolD-like family protein n=1 Tax=Jeotgalibacillus malaysiensis TaxID=1508404 RepID=UPI00384E1447